MDVDEKDTKLAEVQVQLSQLLAVVEEEHKVRKETEERLARKEAQLTKALKNAENKPQGPAPPAKGPKIGVPDKFDGTRGAKAEVFINQVNLYVLANGHLFGTDRAIMVFVLSYLTGPASSWAQPWMKKVMSDTEAISKDDFDTQFTAMYCDTEKKTKAEASLRALKQTKSVSHYTHQFNLHAHNTGWAPAVLVSQYRQGLQSQIRLMLLMSRTEFSELADIATLALQIDNELHGLAPTETAKTPDPNAMDLSVMRGRLSDAEKTRMMRAGQCFQCGNQGHISRDCPDRGQKGKGKEKSRIAELEEEVKQLKAGGSRAESSKNGGAQE
ncbi:hypothetical protein PGT21_050227 [Puccinia graminis f. sp. tritici]|uniref:CCHC-type domain-containing protein n=1 Tax=Puccinia graminis f. sp. tritici TaxID=56615 RepID=A0A5B0Q525_PUCGR|nr:hypothetical protein PGT21_050227 [Puccinia graminis f. sp. tritici]